MTESLIEMVSPMLRKQDFSSELYSLSQRLKGLHPKLEQGAKLKPENRKKMRKGDKLSKRLNYGL